MDLLMLPSLNNTILLLFLPVSAVKLIVVFLLIFQEKAPGFLFWHKEVYIFYKNPDNIAAIFCNSHIDPVQNHCAPKADYIFAKAPWVF